jgi:hypothetical protein
MVMVLRYGDAGVGPIDMRAQTEMPSARRWDTPKAIRLLALRASDGSADVSNCTTCSIFKKNAGDGRMSQNATRRDSRGDRRQPACSESSLRLAPAPE